MTTVTNKYHTKLFRATQSIFMANARMADIFAPVDGRRSTMANSFLEKITKNDVPVFFGEEEMTEFMSKGQVIFFIKRDMDKTATDNFELSELRKLMDAEEKKSPLYDAYISDSLIDMPKKMLSNSKEEYGSYHQHIIDYLVKSDFLEPVESEFENL